MRETIRIETIQYDKFYENDIDVLILKLLLTLGR